MKPSPRKAEERVTRSRGSALVELKTPQKTTRTRSVKTMPEPQEDSVEAMATPSTRSSKRKSASSSTMDVPKSVERRSSRRTRSLAAITSVEDTIAEDSETENKNSNESEIEENLEPRNLKTKVKTSDSADDKPVTRITRRTRSVAPAAVEEPELESIDESPAEKAITKGSKKPKVSEVETKAVEEEPEVEMTEDIEKVEVKQKTKKSKKSEGTEELESGIEDGEAGDKMQETASAPSMEEMNSVVETEKKIKSPKSKKSPKSPVLVVEIEKICVGEGNEGINKESKKSKKKSLDGTVTVQETKTDINMNNEETLLGETEKSVEEPENQEGSKQALTKERDVGEEEIVNFISSCRQETEKTITPKEGISEETMPEKIKTPKKTPKKQKGKPSTNDEASVEELVDNQELESKKTEESIPEEAKLSETPPKQDQSSEVVDVAEVSPCTQVGENKLPEVEVTEDAQVGELAPTGETANDDSEDVKIETPKKKKKLKTPKKGNEETPTSGKNIEVSVFDTPASSPEEVVLPKTSSETTDEVPELETPKKGVESLETPKSTNREAVESTVEEGMEGTETPKSTKKSKSPKKADNLSANGEGPIEESKTSDDTMPEEAEPSKTPKKTPKKRKGKPAAEDEGPNEGLVDKPEPESKTSDETVPEEAEPSKTPKKTPKKQKGKPAAEDEGPNEEMVDKPEPESKTSDETVPEEAEPSKTPKKTPKKRKAKLSVEDEGSVEELVDKPESEFEKSGETIPEEVTATKTPENQDKLSTNDEGPLEGLVDNQELESKKSDETIPEQAESPKKPKKTPRKRKHKRSVEDESEAAEEEATEIVNNGVSEPGEETSGIDQVQDSPVKSPLTENSIAEVVHSIISPLLKDVRKADIQNDADSAVSFEPISKTLLEEKVTNETPDVPPEQGEEENPIVIVEDKPIVIHDSEDEELQNLELMKLIRKLKKKRKILKALEVKENGEKPKKKGKKKKIVKTEDPDATEKDETVGNEEPVEEAVETPELTEQSSTTESVNKKKKKKKIVETEVTDSTENLVEIVECGQSLKEAVKPSDSTEGIVSKKKKRKLAEAVELKKTLKTSEEALDTNAVADTNATTETSIKREHENTEDDDCSNEKKQKLETETNKEMTPGVIYSSSLPTAVDSIELQNLFLEEEIKLLYMRKKNWKTEICIENADQIGTAMSLLSRHYMGNSVRIEKYASVPQTEGLTDDDGLRFRQVYVNQIAPHVTESDLCALFPKAIRCDLPKKNNGISKGFCYLTFPDKTTSREHLILNGKVNLAGYKLGLYARSQDRTKGVYGNLLKEMLVHITDLDTVLIVQNLPSDLHQLNLSKLFPSVLSIHVNSRIVYSRESGAVVICKTSNQAEEFLSQEILWDGKPLTVKRATRDLLYFATKPVGDAYKKPAAYALSTLIVSDLPVKTSPKEIEELFPSCVLINVVVKRKYALVGFSTRAEMLEISRTKNGKLKIKGHPVSVKPYGDEPPTHLIQGEEDFSKLLHVRGFPRGTKRPELKTIFKNCKISMTQTDGVPYAVVKCKNGKKAKEYFSRKNLVVGGRILKIRFLHSILKQMKKEAELK